MPGMDGFQFLKIVKEKYPAVNRVILSGFIEKSVAVESLTRGLASTYILKPWLNEEVEEKFIETNVIFPAGQKLSMSFSLPNYQKPFNFKGQIVWSGSQGIGVKFDSLSPRQKEILKTFSEQSEDIFEIIS